MIGRKNRFHGYGSLNYVYKNGQSVRGPIISIKYTKNPKRQTYRLAVVISKKVLKSAVGRNRIRRRVFEVVRHLSPGIIDAYDIVITIFSDHINELSHEDLVLMVKAQLKQANILT